VQALLDAAGEEWARRSLSPWDVAVSGELCESYTNGFVLCTYWLVECLVLAGERDRASALFADITARANDVGLFAEQIDPATGRHTGNLPQAFSHVGLINAAWRLDSDSDDVPT
jgi:GH15 family glucan-1,4-alpha-glucosidase